MPTAQVPYLPKRPSEIRSILNAPISETLPELRPWVIDAIRHGTPLGRQTLQRYRRRSNLAKPAFGPGSLTPEKAVAEVAHGTILGRNICTGFVSCIKTSLVDSSNPLRPPSKLLINEIPTPTSLGRSLWGELCEGLIKKWVPRGKYGEQVEDARQAARKALVSALQSSHPYDPNRGLFSTWAFKVIVRAASREKQKLERQRANELALLSSFSELSATQAAFAYPDHGGDNDLVALACRYVKENSRIGEKKIERFSTRLLDNRADRILNRKSSDAQNTVKICLRDLPEFRDALHARGWYPESIERRELRKYLLNEKYPERTIVAVLAAVRGRRLEVMAPDVISVIRAPICKAWEDQKSLRQLLARHGFDAEWVSRSA